MCENEINFENSANYNVTGTG